MGDGSADAGHRVVQHAVGVFVRAVEELRGRVAPRLIPVRADLAQIGPADSAGYFPNIHEFIGKTLGPSAQGLYKIIVDDPAGVGRAMVEGLEKVRDYRRKNSDSYSFNWLLKIPLEFQLPFEVSHRSMRALNLSLDRPVHERAADLRRAFSGIVAGNVKDYGVRAIEQFGPFELAGDREIMGPLDQLLRSFVAQRRMKLAGTEYKPCYRLVA